MQRSILYLIKNQSWQDSSWENDNFFFETYCILFSCRKRFFLVNCKKEDFIGFLTFCILEEYFHVNFWRKKTLFFNQLKPLIFFTSSYFLSIFHLKAGHRRFLAWSCDEQLFCVWKNASIKRQITIFFIFCTKNNTAERWIFKTDIKHIKIIRNYTWACVFPLEDDRKKSAALKACYRFWWCEFVFFIQFCYKIPVFFFYIHMQYSLFYVIFSSSVLLMSEPKCEKVTHNCTSLWFWYWTR